MSFSVRTADVDERPLWSADVHESARRSARAKLDALTPSLGVDDQVLVADTLVAAQGRVLGKPLDDTDARRMLELASGSTLEIVSAVFVRRGPEPAAAPDHRVVTTRVSIRVLTDTEIDDYLATGVAVDKAGALELQGAARPFIACVDGCWSNVVGLPVCAAAELLGVDADSTGCRGDRCGT